VLYENLVTIRSPTPETGAPLRDLQVSLESHPTRNDYYADPSLDDILDGYRRRLDNVIVLFPVDGIRCVRSFHQLAPKGLMLLIGDIGTAREADLSEQAAGGMSADSNFWLSVNFHALGEYVQGLGGKARHPPTRHVTLNVSTFLLGTSATDFAETMLAFDEAIGQSGPDEFFVNTRGLADQVQRMSRGQLLAFLRSTASDPDYVVRCLPLLLDSLPEVSWPGTQDLRVLAEEAWEMWYPMGDDSDLADLPAGLGVLLYTIGDYARALEYFLQSLDLVRMDPRTTFNVALCLNRLERRVEAIEWLDRTLELDPSSEKAGEMRQALRSPA
jgi:tetratricopeptide (TPR) repeat protein